MDSDLPNAHLEGGPIGRDFWTFYFAYEVTGKLVDPSAARVLVDAITGNAALYLRPK
jgi:hypothetical protein